MKDEKLTCPHVLSFKLGATLEITTSTHPTVHSIIFQKHFNNSVLFYIFASESTKT